MTLDVDRLGAIDHTSAEHLKDWLQRRRAAGGDVAISGRTEGLKGIAA